ncbi:MAG TPA: serine/threonine-protein kinase [Polyangia bacterium]|nr:serine/threonine-protein kinase [Polyangia bacterium]
MKVCPNCQTKYPDDANFCPQETCATPEGPRRLDMVASDESQGGARYTLEEQIAGQRSGEVFRARDNQSGETVIYKRVARAVLTSPAVIERSQRELKQLQRAQTPRIAKILDFGKDPEGRLFVVSELCDGQPLDQLVAGSGPLPLERAKAIVAQIGEALLDGQKVGVVHHDLAAKNVLVGPGDQVKVINFVAPVPVTETVFGVPEYLSPEQAEGKLVDQRSNTYSLGGILMLMLTGRPPIEAVTPAGVLEQVLKATLSPPSARIDGLNAEIDRVVMKAMDRSPNRRPLTLRQFLTEVANLSLGPAAQPDPGRLGVAKTMMFSGATPEMQNLVNQAIAARAQANGAGSPQERNANLTPPIAVVASEAPSPKALDPNATPPPVRTTAPEAPRRTHGAAIAATMVAMPAAAPRAAGTSPPAAAAPPRPDSTMDSMQATPPPVAATPPGGSPPVGAPPPAAAAGTPPKSTGPAAFRETLWFKQGDVDQMVADARAKLESNRPKGTPAPEPEPVVAETKPLEERYVDDGSVSVEDRKKYSLRQGATSSSMPTVGGKVPGERMSAEEMMGEIGGGKRFAIVVIAVLVVAAVVLVVVLGFRGKKVATNAAALTPVAVPSEPAAPAPPPPPAPAPAAAAPAATPPAPAAAAPAAPAPSAPAAAADDDDQAAPAAPKAHSHHHASAKKPKGKKHK